MWETIGESTDVFVRFTTASTLLSSQPSFVHIVVLYPDALSVCLQEENEL